MINFNLYIHPLFCELETHTLTWNSVKLIHNKKEFIS